MNHETWPQPKQESIPQQGGDEMEKINVSNQWISEEREALKKSIEVKIQKIAGEVNKIKALMEQVKVPEQIAFMQNNLKKLDYKLEDLEGLLERLDDKIPSEFLQMNRINYKEFISE